jgi:hypothetical protein
MSYTVVLIKNRCIASDIYIKASPLDQQEISAYKPRVFNNIRATEHSPHDSGPGRKDDIGAGLRVFGRN